ATHRTGPMTAAEIMSRDLITVQPETPLAEVAALFRRHRFTSLPVVGAEGRFLGVIFQIHLILRAQADAARRDRGFAAAARRLMDPKRAPGVLAADLMAVAIPRVSPQTPIAALLPMMADGRVDAVPVLQGQAITGIVTRTDLIAALARQTLREG
ncbi:CBS domain-containing protein, partial [Rhodobacter capsulatus]